MTTLSSIAHRTRTTYGSARDLPSYQELDRQIQVGKLLTLFFARDQRKGLLQIERDLNRLVVVVDAFYERLGSRNWIFHDLLSIDRVEAILAETSDAETAEVRLIEMYRDPDATKWWSLRLRAHDGLRMRSHQIERAQEHYDADQFDSCTLQLIAIMDGFVNDFEPQVRKGLHARTPDEMAAWDSVVGHHMGLTNALKTFWETKKKRVDDEVFEVYRHGIMHGSVTKFDNVVVATKAWNMLYAVADWATATQKAAQPAKPEPSWSDLWETGKRHGAHQRYKKNFASTTITPSDAEFRDDAVAKRAAEFLDAWQSKRWGHVAAFAPPVLVGSKSAGQAAQAAKNVFGQHDLSRWDIAAVTYDQPSTAEIWVAGTMNGVDAEFRFRMVCWTAEGKIAIPTDEGPTWRLAIWAPATFFPDDV